MSKINNLYKYLINNGFQKEASFLVKIALDQYDFEKNYPKTYSVWSSNKDKSIFEYIKIIEKMEELNLNPDDYAISGFDGLVEILFEKEYPNIFSIWKRNRDKPVSAYLSQIQRAKSKGINLEVQNISSFDDIIKILKGEKVKEKESRANSINNFLKESGIDELSEEDVKMAIQANLSNEEILFLAKDECNHTWFEKIKIADEFNKSKSTLFDEEISILNFNNIDDVRDEYFFKKNKKPLQLELFYEKIKNDALENSEVVYNSKNFIVVHSKTQEAAQYWEQSSVTEGENGRISSGLCSAHPYDSLFNMYDPKIHSFQIITKEYETLKETPRTSFDSKNKGYNLISLSIQRGFLSGDEYRSAKRSNTFLYRKVLWGGENTVNRYNGEVGPFTLRIVLGDEYYKICNKIIKYCKDNLNVIVENLKKKKGLNPERIEEIQNNDFLELYFNSNIFLNFKESERYSRYLKTIIENSTSTGFFKFKMHKIKDIFTEDYIDKLTNERIRSLASEYYFRKKLDEEFGDKFPKVLEEKLKYIRNNLYFKYKLDEKYKEKYPKLFTKLLFDSNKDLQDYEYYYFQYKLDDKYGKEYPKLLEENLKEVDEDYYFKYKLDEKYKEKYPEIFREKFLEIRNAKFFEYKLDDKYGEKYPKMFKKLLGAASEFNYFVDGLDEKWGNKYPEILEEKLKSVNSSMYFASKLDETWGEKYPKILEEKVYNIYTEGYFEYKLDDKYKEKFPIVFQTHLFNASRVFYFQYKLDEKYREEFPESLIWHLKADYDREYKIKDDHNYFNNLKLDDKYGEEFPEILKEKLSRISHDYYLKYKLDEKWGEKFPKILEKQLKRLDLDRVYITTLKEIKQKWGSKFPEIFKK